ncbi:UbiA prenyltransferase family-domain-containing protein [Aspergillus crustosus]
MAHPESNNQYSGNHRSGWLDSVPDAMLPYIQLARLSPPAGLFLIYFPHLSASFSPPFSRSDPPLSLFVSNAIHIWNDLIDAPLDAQVERTCKRPIPRGAVSPAAAFVFTLSQTIGAMLFLPLIPGGFIRGFLYVLPGIIGWTYYPWAKRHTYYPQLALGLCLAWGLLMGCLALDLPILQFVVANDGNGTSLFRVHVEPAASTLWTIIYDTVYAHQDLADDKKAGIKSLAVLYGTQTKQLLWQLLVAKTALFGDVDLTDGKSCWWWFGNGFWLAGGSVVGGLVLELELVLLGTLRV